MTRSTTTTSTRRTSATPTGHRSRTRKTRSRAKDCHSRRAVGFPGVAEQFRVAVAQPVLDDLARRLELARWPQAYALDGGEDAARLDRIARLLERWRGGYEWREHEARINEHEQALVSGLLVLKAGRRARALAVEGRAAAPPPEP